ncbi:hypothetical protein L3i20_v212700 [Paenibacillus sp. L3-i20]|nr:hypothetical protein L3i20_v212700 [Paenibacillus sp. L3-i20]
MGERKIKSILQLHNETNITRKSLSNLYNDKFKAVETETINRLCSYFGCTVGELLEFVPDAKSNE